MPRPPAKSFVLSLMLVLCAALPGWAQPYFERSQVIQNPAPPNSGFGEDVDVDGEWMVVAASSESAASSIGKPAPRGRSSRG